MSGYVLTEHARRDVESIVEYVERASGIDAAMHVLNELEKAFCLIADAPGVGVMRNDLAELPVRCWVVFNYLIAYQPESSPVVIYRVVHGARDLPVK